MDDDRHEKDDKSSENGQGETDPETLREDKPGKRSDE